MGINPRYGWIRGLSEEQWIARVIPSGAVRNNAVAPQEFPPDREDAMKFTSPHSLVIARTEGTIAKHPERKQSPL
jgi:hypothetical protein